MLQESYVVRAGKGGRLRGGEARLRSLVEYNQDFSYSSRF